MGLTIDKQAAAERFSQALALARSDTPLPEEWLTRTRRIGKAHSKTFTPVLGTALLAKATERFVDAFSLREGESHKSYSARSVAKEILVPCCVRAGIDIRNRGAEPLNNQPFLRAIRISTELKVKSNSVVDLEYLCECLGKADFLEGRQALEALAAFLRVRIDESGRLARVELGPGLLDLAQLAKAVDGFAAGESEGGKVGQAMATAVLDIVFGDVRTKKINDPSNKWPGDIGVFGRDSQTLSAEVKQRPINESEVLLFASRLHEGGIRRAFVVALSQGHLPLDIEQLRFQAQRLYGIEVTCFFTLGSMLETACAMALEDLPFSLASFPRHALERMAELEVSELRQREWASLFAVADAGRYPSSTNE